MTEPYSPPVSQLLSSGDTDMGAWPNYGELGLRSEHVPELIRMARDPQLNESEQDSLEIWAPVHA